MRRAAEQSAFDAVYGVMQLLDGISLNDVDEDHRAAYVLTSRIERGDQTLETFELAPDGDGLCMALHGWWQNDFGDQ